MLFQRANHKILDAIIYYRKVLSSKWQFSWECRYNNKKQFVILMKYVRAVYLVVCASDVVAEQIKF